MASRYPPEFRRRVLDLIASGRKVADVARDLGVSGQTIYNWRKQDLIDRGERPGLRSAELAELMVGGGVLVGHNAVAMLMHRAGLKGLPGNKRPRSRHEAPTAEDLVDRAFARTAPDELWVTDITEHPTREGKVYCAVVLDAFSRRVVGWSIDSSPPASLATHALDMAIAGRLPSGTLIHSDHGTQFTSRPFTERAKR